MLLRNKNLLIVNKGNYDVCFVLAERRYCCAMINSANCVLQTNF